MGRPAPTTRTPNAATGFATGFATGKGAGTPEKGERGVLSSEDSLFRLRPYGSPTVRQIEQMLREDSWASSVEGAIAWPIRSAEFDIEGADEDSGEAEACREVFLKPAASGGMKTPIETVIGQMTGAIARRVSYHEIVWGLGTVNGRLMHVVEKLAFREASTCEVETDEGGNLGFRQRAYTRTRGFVDQSFDGSKALVYVHDSSSSPLTGSSALESAYRNYQDKRKLRFLYYKALEKYGTGPTVAKTESQDPDDQEAVFKKGEVVRSGGTVGLGPGESIEFPQFQGVGDQFKEAIRELNFETAVSCYVQWLALAQEGNSGAYALSRDHSDFLVIVTMGRMHEIASAITTQPMAQFVRYNFGPDAAFPTFKFRSLVEEDKARALDVWTQLITKAGDEVDPAVREAIQEKALQALDVKPEKANKDATGNTSGSNESTQPETPAELRPPTTNDPVVRQAQEALRQRIGA